MRELAKSMSSLVLLLYCVCLFFTEMGNKMRKFVDILEQSLSHFIRLCAIFKFVDWFTINKIMLLTSNKYRLFLLPTKCKCNILV